jgi:sigma-E factor negative regulatory protein RseA
MGEQSIQNLERISALVDGQLSQDEFSQTLTDLESSSQLRENWDTYHLLGDAMRSGSLQAQQHDAEFVRKLRQKISVVAINNIASNQENTRANLQNWPKQTSANDSSWRLVAGLASVALAGVLTWQGINWTTASNPATGQQLVWHDAPVAAPSASPPQLASAEPVQARQVLVRRDGTSALTMSSDEPQVMIRDPHLDALLAAHRQFGGASALQMPSGFLRNATYEEGGR